MPEDIKSNLFTALNELYEAAHPETGSVLVVGCSTSEVIGQKIGTGGSDEVAKVLFETINGFCREKGLYLAAQCCEHLNRSLVVEKECAKTYGFSRVNAVPQLHAGGAFATAAYRGMKEPWLVEKVIADLGLDIGNTLIGMHIRPVCVPVRVSVKTIGEAPLVLARSRCRYVGGERAAYDPKLG